MSTQLATESAMAVSPDWTLTELTTITDDPGDNAVDFVVNAFSPAYLGTGTDVNGQLCTQTAVAKVSAVGTSAPTFSNLQTFGDTIATRQMQGSICANGWYIVASYDSTNGTRVRYTTDHGATWSAYVTISATTNGSGWTPGLWLSQRTPGLAVVTAFAGGASGQSWDFTIDEQGFTNYEFNGFYEAGNGWRSGATPQINGSINGYRFHARYDFGSDVNITSTTGYVAGGIGDGYVYFWDSSPAIVATFGMWTTYATSGVNSKTEVVTHNNIRYISIRRNTFAPAYTGPTYFTALSVTTDTGTSASAYVTTDYGANWSAVSSAATVGFIQPGDYISGAIESPYTDTSPYRFVYGTIDDSGTYAVPRLDRVVSTVAADISPVADSKTYGVPIGAHRRAVCISVTDPNTAILCGQSRNATTGTSTYRVFKTTNLWASTPTWTAMTDESASVEWRGVYIAGDTPLVAYFLGTNGNFGYWDYNLNTILIYDKVGNSTKTGVSAVGLCGF